MQLGMGKSNPMRLLNNMSAAFWLGAGRTSEGALEVPFGQDTKALTAG